MENSPLHRSNTDYFLIPVPLCQHVLKEKASRSFQVYMALKYHCSGTITINVEVKRELASDLNVSIRTIELELKKLVKLKWVGNKNTTYYIRSLKTLKQSVEHQNDIGVRFEEKDLRTIKGFLVGTLICYFIKVNLHKEKKKREGSGSRLLKRRGKALKRLSRNTSSGSLSPYSFANSILAKVLNISMSTASQYKNEAAKHKYIKIKKSFFKYLFNATCLNSIKKAFPEDAHRITVNRKKVAYRKPDIVTPLMGFKPIKTYERKRYKLGGDYKRGR